jgi:hypothetical protein
MSGGRPRTLLVAALSLAAGLLAGLRAEVGVALRVTVLREGRRRLLGIAVEEAGGGA